jgi:murein DD-endopeptidase MepM/ murein hydrolase activator NlpD
MSSKAEKTLNHSHKQSRLNIFFRSPLLLKIVAWLGSLSFLGSTGLALADLKSNPIARSEAPELIQAAVSPSAGNGSATLEDKEVYGPSLQAFAPKSAGNGFVKLENQETYGPYLPVDHKPSPVQASLEQLPNREVPVAVAPASAVILPTGTIVRPPHTDLMTADNYTVSVNKSAPQPKTTEEFADASASTPLVGTMPGRSREIVRTTSSQVQASDLKSQSVVSRSAPTTSIQAKSKSARTVSSYQTVPAVAILPANSISQRMGKSGANLPTSVANEPTLPKGTQRQLFTPQVVPLAGLRHTVVAPMKPAVTAKAPIQSLSTFASVPTPAEESIEILVPAPRTGRIEVQSVTHLPQISDMKLVPTVPAIPSVRPAAVAASQSQPLAFANLGANESRAELGYPLSRPAPTTSRFGWRTHPITGSRRFHSGMDIGAPMGAPVVAAGTGIIISSGWLGGYGKAIVIQHNGVQQTLYGHLSEVFVQPGQRIEQGTVIGRVGSTGNSTGPHLHFETRAATTDGWVAVDPGEQIEYALDNLRRSAPFAQRDLPPGYN